jgi:UDP-N-acetylglucosamine/UDP-N-acetylgalactosamine diphosphorylase
MGRNTLHDRLARFGQQHLLDWWDELDAAQRSLLGEQITAIDFAELDSLVQQARRPDHLRVAADSIAEPPALRLPVSEEQRRRWRDAEAVGRGILAEGKVAVVLVAGGQGTRLGFDQPKGMYPIGPVSGKTLFQLHAEKALATARRYATRVPYCVMTSDATHEATVKFFEQHGRFGLAAADVVFFRQGRMPAVDAETGKVLLAAKDRIATSPNGHGGVLEAMGKAGILDDLRRRGVELVFYHQVDNPLVKVCDPVFLGLHVQEGSEASTKAVAKRHPHDKVGLLVARDGKVCIIEYTDLPEEIATATNGAGRLRYWAGSTAIHVFNVDFLARMHAAGTALPYHCANKKVPYVGDTGELRQPDQPNAYKFERFLFDILPQAGTGLVVETDRAEEYDPLKNASGEHSPESVKRSLSALHRHWLRQAGVSIPSRQDDSLPAVEISPLYALDAEELATKVPDKVDVSQPLYLAPREAASIREVG